MFRQKIYRKYIRVALLVMLGLADAKGAEIWVSPEGAAGNQGTREHPLCDVAQALRKARELRRLNDPSVKGGIHIILRGGTYILNETLFIRPEDSGSAESPTFIEAAPGELPVLSGGLRIKAWHVMTRKIPGLPAIAGGKIWEADIPSTGDPSYVFRQLWVNGKKAVRARNVDESHLQRILSWNRKNESCMIPASAAKGLHGGDGLEMFIHQWWAVAMLRVKTITYKGDSARLTFFQPESRVQSEHPWPAPWISAKTGNSAFYLTNAIQFLDQPGEWFCDQKNQKIYYIPHPGEHINSAEIVAPFLETLVKIEGTPEHPVSYFRFRGISFEHAGWQRPSRQGHVALQAGMFMLDAYKLKIPGTPEKSTLENQAWLGRPAAAAELTFSRQTVFESCRFEHLASTGLDYRRGNEGDRAEGNLFKDIGGSALLAGVFSDETFEAHLAWNPGDQREVSRDMQISNNMITDAANEDWGCVGIGAGFVKNINIEHNDISNIPYSGISLGWGWTKDISVMSGNKIMANRITHYGREMYDVAGIYTLSAQPGSLIAENCVDSIYAAPYAHDPHHWFYLYNDEGSSYFTVRDNWCPAEKFLQNANGPGNVWENNGPHVADSVRLAAGLKAKYRYLLKEKTVADVPVNTVYTYTAKGAQPAALEVIASQGRTPDLSVILSVCRQHGISGASVYQWKNHIVIFDDFLKDAGKIAKQITSLMKNCEVKTYTDIYYNFSRQDRCKGTPVAKEWENVLLTADLVADSSLRKEYFDAHASQFGKWPEVARGFCNADFQRLLGFRSGRQLLLVISIPKGKTLDELNPKTTENNPRAGDWNKLMAKYQKGIPGTADGEVWVFFSPLDPP